MLSGSGRRMAGRLVGFRKQRLSGAAGWRVYETRRARSDNTPRFRERRAKKAARAPRTTLRSDSSRPGKRAGCWELWRRGGRRGPEFRSPKAVSASPFRTLVRPKQLPCPAVRCSPGNLPRNYTTREGRPIKSLYQAWKAANHFLSITYIQIASVHLYRLHRIPPQ